MARALAPLLLALSAFVLIAVACGDKGDFLLDENEPESTETPPFFQRTPLASPEPSPAGSPTAAAGTATPGACGETYTVQSGDVPYSIAEKCGVGPDETAAWVDELLKINGIEDPTTLKIGQKLKLPEVQE